MQPMVVLTKQQWKESFSERLNHAVEKKFRVAESDRPHTVLVKGLFPKGYKLSYEAARKWVSGESMPDMTHASMLCAALEINPTWLLTNKGDMAIGSIPQTAGGKVIALGKQLPEWIDRYGALTPPQRYFIDGVVTVKIDDLEAETNAARRKSRR